MKTCSNMRDLTIDIVRGIAIFIMVGANMTPLLPEPHALSLRFYASCAAPIFVILAGAMVALAALMKPQLNQLSYFIKRGVFLLIMGALCDVVCWGIVPFISLDVLYLLGLGLPIFYVASKYDKIYVLLVAALIVGAAPLLQAIFGYAASSIVISLGDFQAYSAISFTGVIRDWLFEGVFPVFPWMGYGLFGVALAKYRWENIGETKSFATREVFFVAMAAIILGLAGMALFPGELLHRLGFSELFYPAKPGFVIFSMGVVIGLIGLVDMTKTLGFWTVFLPLGEASLFMFLVHMFIIERFILPIGHVPVQNYLGFYAGLVAALFACGLWLRVVKRSYRDMPLALKWVLGG